MQHRIDIQPALTDRKVSVRYRSNLSKIEETDKGSSILDLIEGKDLIKKKQTNLITEGKLISKTTAIGEDHTKLQRP